MADQIVIPMGRNAQLFFGPPNVMPNTAANVLSGAVDVNVIIEKEDADCRRRGSGAWADAREGVKDLRITWNLMGTTTDAGTEVTTMDIIRKTFLSGIYNGAGDTGIALYAKALAGSATGGGPWGDFIITRFERAEVHGDPQSYSCEARMTQVHGNIPTWVNHNPA